MLSFRNTIFFLWFLERKKLSTEDDQTLAVYLYEGVVGFKRLIIKWEDKELIQNFCQIVQKSTCQKLKFPFQDDFYDMVTWSSYRNVFLTFIYIHMPASFQAAVSFCLRRYKYICTYIFSCTNTDTLPKTMCNLTKSLTQQLLQSFSIWRQLASLHCCQCFSCHLLLLN